MEEKISEYQFYKSLGVCPVCKKRKMAPGRAKCPECAKKSRDYQRKYKQKRLERVKSDPEYKKKIDEYHRKATQKYQERHKRMGLCEYCGRPVKPGCLFCEKHLNIAKIRYRAKYTKNSAYARPHLDIPQIRGHTKTDVGKLIALYNAGWSYKQIEGEMRISYGTIHRWVTIARKEQHCETPHRSTIATREHLDASVLPPKSNHVKADVDRIIELYNDGLTYRDIADNLGVSLSTVFRWIGEARKMAV